MLKHYNHFVSQENTMKKAFDQELFPTDIRDLTEAQVAEIKEHIECGLSPENLHCDGEATQSEVENKMEHYHMLCREINSNTSFKFEIDELNY